MQEDKMLQLAKEQASLVQAYMNVFKTEDGERVLKDLMETHGVLKHSFSGDVSALLIGEGERKVVLAILKKLNANTAFMTERIERYAKERE